MNQVQPNETAEIMMTQNLLFSVSRILDMINKFNIEALQNIYNIDSFASHYDFIVPKKPQTIQKRKHPIVSSVQKTERIINCRARELLTKDMKQYKKYWYMEHKKEDNERSKLWRINHPERYRELMKRCRESL